MHAMFFGIKRWHLRIVETTKKLLQPDSLTPARFDLMRAIAARDGEMTQRSLQWLFGVSAVTICRMCKGLEEKGFVRRERLAHDRRIVNVIITRDGYKAFRRDLAYCVKSRINEYLAAALVTENKHANIDSRTVRRRVERATDHLTRGRRILRDRSPVRHAWARRDFATLGMIALRHEMSNRPIRRRRPPRDKSAPRPWEVAPKPRPTLARAQPTLDEGRAGLDEARPALATARPRRRAIDTPQSLLSTEELLSRMRAEAVELEATDKAEIDVLRAKALARLSARGDGP